MFAQQPAPAPSQANQDVTRISTQLVQVDVVVTDKKGRHVEDLSQADFELLVDGKKQALTYFSHINLPGAIKREPAAKQTRNSSPPPASMPTRQIEPAEVNRTIAFVVDDLGLSFRSTELVRETLRKFVAEQMQEGDLVAVIRTGNGLGMLEQFTSDKRILYSAIERLSWNPLSRDMSPAFADGSTELTDDQADKQAVLDAFEEFRETNFSTGTLGAIGFVVQGLRSLPGRKSVILLSDGFRVYSQNNDDSNTNQIIDAMKNLVEMAGRSRVVIYSMDARGLQAYMPGPDVGGRPSAGSYSDAQQSALEALDGPVYLANQTGGFLITNSNDLNIGIGQALYDQQSYYLLGFDPEDEKFDKRFHSIKVNVTRPGLNVRARSGFFGVEEEATKEAPKTRGEQILSALLSPLGKRDLSLRMTPYFFNSSKDGPLVRTLFHIDCSKLSFKENPDGSKHLNLELAAFAFNELGATADMTAHRINLSFDPEQYRRVLANGLAYRKDFQLKKPGAYQFRAVLRDQESGSTGSASQFIHLPDLNDKRLAMSGLVLTTPKQSSVSDKVEARSTIELNTTPYVRIFPRTGWIQYGAAVYNASVDKKTGQPRIRVQAEIYRDGKSVYQFPARTIELSPGANPKHFDYVGRLRLNEFPAGDYLLRLVVTDDLAKKKINRVEQWMDFIVK
jgi:VWFA-related protein